MKRLLPILVLPVALTACASATVAPPAGPAVNPAPLDTPAAGDEFVIRVGLDLTAVSDDRLPVEIDPGVLEQGDVLYRLPRVVQGTYSVSDFGGFTEDLQAFDYDGQVMPTERVDVNTWRIPGAGQLDRLSYYVNDTFDLEGSSEDIPFSPAGTNIDPEIFVLNLHGFIGYFEGLTEEPYELQVTAPLGTQASSALRPVASDTSSATGTVTDTYRAQRYFDVTDNPMMYGEIDTLVFDVDGIEITLSVYSPTGVHSADALRGDMYDMMAAQRRYLGDLATTSRYDVYLYLSQVGPGDPMGFGALEHHTSTVTVLPEFLPDADLTDAMVDVISHEFFHIVSPLGVHSEDIRDFDYDTPTFSKHLWMYEGVTEYFASHFQVYEGLEARPDFYQKMAEKIDNSHSYDDAMSFTLMSENILDEPYATSYGNVYEKGALIGMCLDLILREQSDGDRSMLSLMRELASRYGSERAFEDDGLIDEITTMTYPEVGAFLETHVVGDTPIDYSSCLAGAGLTVARNEVPTLLFFLDPQVPFIDANPATGELFFRQIPLNSTLVALGIEGGDVIESVNSTRYTLDNIAALVQASVTWTPDMTIEMIVLRDGERVEVSGPMGTPSVTRTNIQEVPGATAAQLELREAWLGG